MTRADIAARVARDAGGALRAYRKSNNLNQLEL